MNPAIDIIFADIHDGCQLGLMRPTGAALDEGGRAYPSAFQLSMWAHWKHAWGHWLKGIVANQAWNLVNVGDTVDGDHHQAVTQWTHNIERQADDAIEILSPIVKRCHDSGGRYFHIRGTEAHGGKSGQAEERIARALGAVPNKEGQYARWDLWKWIGPKRKHLVHYAHHVSLGGVTAYLTTGIFRELVESLIQSARWNERPPDAVVRAHVHRHIPVPLSGMQDGKRVRRLGIIVPGWQGKTPLSYRMGSRQAMPEFGIVALIVTPEGELYTRDYTHTPERPEPE